MSQLPTRTIEQALAAFEPIWEAGPVQMLEVAAPNENALPMGVEPGPCVNPEISTYSTAASTTVIATSRIVAMIGDTARFRDFLQLRSLCPKTFIPFFLREAFRPAGDAMAKT